MKEYKTGPYHLCTIFQVFWIYMLALNEKINSLMLVSSNLKISPIYSNIFSEFIGLNGWFLKCPYYGYLKSTFHAVCNTVLSEWKVLHLKVQRV